MKDKDADTPEELTSWIWCKFVGVPAAGPGWEQEREELLDRVRRMDRSSFTKGLHEGANQMKALKQTERRTAMGPEDQHEQPFDKEDYEKWQTDTEKIRKLRRSLIVLMKLVEDGVLVRNTASDGCMTD